MTSNQQLISLQNNTIITKPKADIDEILSFDYLNPMGSILAMSMAPKLLNLEPYLHQLNIKQQMLTYLYQLKSKANIAPYLSPYTQEPAYQAEKRFCIATNQNSENDICIGAF